ncbi:MAG: HPr kinase/phosphatase C-terminal domain-containing protein [Paracoccaceae bacterium]|nr:HPr kinase/phosphatase C-terminal domain-containing protein [Paracoccaceae bacterium]
MMSETPTTVEPMPTQLHASCVAYRGQGVVILGPSGSGKSALALQLMGYGANLVADDQTTLTASNGDLIASCPPAIAGLIEARGIGLLNTDYVAQICVKLVVDLDRVEEKRLPDMHSIELAGVTLTCLYKVKSPHFPPAILHFLTYGRQIPE